MCTEGGWDCTTFEFHFILLLIRRWTKSCTLTQSFISGLTGLLVFSSSIEFPFFLQLGVTSHYNPVVNIKPLTHYSMLLYKQLPQETGQVSSGEGVGGGVFLIFSFLKGICRPKVYGFAPFWSENGYRLCPFWSEFW